jgi:hypothetical protein
MSHNVGAPAALPPAHEDGSKLETACFGVLCPAHETCARYHAVESAPMRFIASCFHEGDNFPLYVQWDGDRPGRTPW